MADEQGEGHEVRIDLDEESAAPVQVSSDRMTTLRLLKKRDVERVEVEDAAFHAGSPVLLPTRRKGQGEEGDGGLTGLAALGTVLRRVQAEPDRKLIVLGHAAAGEPGGGDLAARRARSVQLYLAGDRDGWAKLANEGARCEDWQLILKWVARERGWDCDPGGVDDKEGKLTRGALKKFRVCYRKLFGRDLSCSCATIEQDDWTAIYDCMDAHLAGIVGCKLDELRALKKKALWLEPAWRAFGSDVPRSGAGIAHRSASDRRVDVLLFSPADAPDRPAEAALYPLVGGKLETVDVPVTPDTYTPGQDGLEHHEHYDKNDPKQPDPVVPSAEYGPPKWRKGEKGDPIKAYQQKLLTLGFPMPRWGADGDLGDEALSATKYFQDKHKVLGEHALKQLGVGQATIEAVERAWAALPPEKRNPPPPPPAPPEPPPTPVPPVEAVPDYSTYPLLADPLNPPKLVDVTAKADKSVRHGKRDWSKVEGITLHQTACLMGNNPPRYYDLHAHIAVTTDGSIIYVHPMNELVWHGHGFNGRDVGIEIDGHYAGIEGNMKTYWRPAGSKRQPMTCSPLHLQAVRDCIQWICATVKSHGGEVKYIHAHRQSSGDRISDPGSHIWLHTGRWARKVLGLLDGGPTYKSGSGRPIPEVWDPDYVGVKYQ